MYCYTLVNNLNCVFNELILWTDISSEHPIFIKTVADLTKKNLPKDIENKLMDTSKNFRNLNKKAMDLRRKTMYYQMPFPHTIMCINKLINEFFILDTNFVKLLNTVDEYGKEDKVWQTLLHHIEHEQKFMYELFQNIDRQI